MPKNKDFKYKKNQDGKYVRAVTEESDEMTEERILNEYHGRLLQEKSLLDQLQECRKEISNLAGIVQEIITKHTQEVQDAQTEGPTATKQETEAINQLMGKVRAKEEKNKATNK